MKIFKIFMNFFKRVQDCENFTQILRNSRILLLVLGEDIISYKNIRELIRKIIELIKCQRKTSIKISQN